MRKHLLRNIFSKKLHIFILLPIFVLFLGVPLRAQESHKPQNLQVLPEDIGHDQLIEIMRGFTQALDVRCSFCHAQDPNNPNELDFPADKKQTKKVARVMLRMTATINKHLLPETGLKDIIQVQCVTCHHGLKKPHTLQYELQTAYKTGGIDTAVARYKKVRQKYYGLGAFDFGESALILTAQDFEKSGNFDAAEKFLNMNLNYFPKSANTYTALAMLSHQKGDQKQAMDYFHQALEIEPNNPRIRYMMNQVQQQNQNKN